MDLKFFFKMYLFGKKCIFLETKMYLSRNFTGNTGAHSRVVRPTCVCVGAHEWRHR